MNTEREKRGIVAIDGKTIRGSGNADRKAYHVVSAFVAENQITSDLLMSKKIVTADAMSCQKEIAAKITERGADYVLSLHRLRILMNFLVLSESIGQLRISSTGILM